MTGLHAVIFFSALSGVAALIAFFWAVTHRQFRQSEPAKYAVLDDDGDMITDSQVRVQQWQVRVFMTVIALVFVFIALSIWVTIVAAAHTPAPISK